MGALNLLAFAAALLASPDGSRPSDPWANHIAEASARFGLPAEWIRSVIQAESGGRTMLAGKPITSSAGAMGLMQLMPGTWAEMQAKYGLGLDPHNPRDNILAGTAYLSAMYDRFGHPGLFAAYNAGPSRYARHLETGRPLPSETIAYVAKIEGRARREFPTSHGQMSSSPIFVKLDPSEPVDNAPPPQAPPASFFVQLGIAAPN